MRFRRSWPAAVLAGLLAGLLAACQAAPLATSATPVSDVLRAASATPALPDGAFARPPSASTPPGDAIVAPPAPFQGLVQDPAVHLAGAGWRLDPAHQERLHQALRQAHFAPWSQDAPLLAAGEFQTMLAGLLALPGYGENTLPRGPEWGERLRELAAAESYPNAGWPGLTLGAADLRALPTRRPLLEGFDHPGQGLAFDRLQESLLAPGTPVWVCHASRDGAWLFCDTPIGSHWLAAHQVARAQPALVETWRQAPLAAVA